jgi:predicted metal-dependent hydrolase
VPFPPREVHLPLTGERWRVFVAGGAGRPRLVESAGVLELRGQGESAHWRRCLLAWVKRRAEAILKPLLDAEALRHGLVYRTLSIRHQRTRWGSCSTRGQISLNLALLFQAPEVVRYLLCHELAHTRHMNHSARFWQLVEQCEPRWRALDAELTTGWRHVPAWLREQP